jgi:hypothetical protein
MPHDPADVTASGDVPEHRMAGPQGHRARPCQLERVGPAIDQAFAGWRVEYDVAEQHVDQPHGCQDANQAKQS